MKKKFPDHFNRIKKTLKPKLEELDLKMLGKFNISYTKNSKDPFAYMVESNKIHFINTDVITSSLNLEKFDCINLLAVVEHILGSPKSLLAKIHSMLKDTGNFIFVVPNQARLIRRLGLMFGGISVQPDYKDYYESEYPYEGHHRKYVETEVKYMFDKSNFQIILLDSVKYKPHGSFLKKIITFVGNALPKNFHQAFFVTAKKKVSN